MTTMLFVIGVVIGTLALVVLAALLHGAGAYLNSRWRHLKLHR
jgi:ABC-type lipoprotein release transport system permease subunit